MLRRGETPKLFRFSPTVPAATQMASRVPACANDRSGDDGRLSGY
jgi:hypothetical protein